MSDRVRDQYGLYSYQFQVLHPTMLFFDVTAFATRAMPAGSMVAPAPIVQISDRRSLDAIRVKQDPNTGADVEEHVKLLLLNYCFGNPKSSLLFFPYVSSALVQYVPHAVALCLFHLLTSFIVANSELY